MSYISNDWDGDQFFDIKDFSHIEFYVGNAKQAAFYYIRSFGFQPFAYCGPETGSKNKVSYILKQNNIYFMLSSGLSSNNHISKWISVHGDGVRDIAFKVGSSKNAYDSVISRGGLSNNEYSSIEDSDGFYETSSVKTYGDTIHSFISDSKYNGHWAPNFMPWDISINSKNICGLQKIDHVVGNVEIGKMETWRKYYESSFGFSTFVKFDENDISTEYSALKSVVLRSKNWKIKLPINEPAKGIKKSQIEEYLNSNCGPGVQHIALTTNDIISTIKQLRANDVEFLDVPVSYYDNLRKRVGSLDEDIGRLKELKILVDRDEQGYLLQLFTKPLQDRPTLFIEIIQRKGSRGFGQGNFQALFEAIEKEQEKRGNL